jgi:ASC-1-like (ASCH) protein
MINAEPYQSIMPWANSAEEVVSLLRQFYPPKKEQFGVVVLQFDR